MRREREAARARERALRETNQQMETFLGIASHELKTPLTSIMLGIERLQRRVQQSERPLSEGRPRSPPRWRRCTRWPKRRSSREAGCTGWYRNCWIPPASRRDGSNCACSQPIWSRSSAWWSRSSAWWPQSGRSCSTSGGRSAVLVSADAERLGQVVTNYLSNALRYSGEALRWRWGSRWRDRQGRVWVRDQGPGIPEGEQERLWERFYRVPEASPSRVGRRGAGDWALSEQDDHRAARRPGRGPECARTRIDVLVHPAVGVDEQGQEGSIGQDQRSSRHPTGPEEAGPTP